MASDTLSADESLQVIDRSFRAFLDLVASVPEDRMLEPNTVGIWSGKDIVADIAGWERVVSEYIQARDRGWRGYLPPAEPDGTWDAFNQSNVDPTGEWSLPEVVAHFSKIHHEFMRVAAASEHTDWPSVVRITRIHYEEHEDDLKRLAASR